MAGEHRSLSLRCAVFRMEREMLLLDMAQRPFWEQLPWWECSCCACLSFTCPSALPS